MTSVFDNLGMGQGGSRGGAAVGGDDDVLSERGSVGGLGGGRSGAVERGDAAPNVLAGREVLPDKRKYRYDVLRGRGRGLPFEVSRDAVMSADEAGAMLHKLHERMGIANENEEVLSAFGDGLMFCHTVNGASVLVPGRSKFSVPGHTVQFDYGEIRDILGADMRRFFRAYADDITDVNRRVMRDYDSKDPVRLEQWAWLQEVAYARGLSRYPHLAHDSADACLRLSVSERHALQQSKAIVIGGTPNAADKMKPGSAVFSADRYDSSVGTQF